MAQDDLTLVGLTKDKMHLVLVSHSGEEYTLPVDGQLRAALRGDHARLGQLEIQMEIALRPRDIQARIRAGESPENVAVAANTTLDRIMGYATPVLAERAHVADRAQRASVRRKSGEGPSRLLAESVAERLRSRNVDPSTVEWDAWRREDGRWTLVADYRSGDSARHAEFSFDVAGRYVVAEDEDARWLVGEQTSSKGPQPRAAGTGPRRLTAVSLEDDELPLGEDAIGLVSQPEDRSTEESLDARADASEDASEDDASAAPDGATDGVTDGATDDEHTVDLSDVLGGQQTDSDPRPSEAPEEQETARRAKKGRGRASVPSWDEIMFGGGKTD